MIEAESKREFPLDARPTKIAAWGCLFLLGVAFAVLALFGIRPVERLLAGAFASLLIAISFRMIWPLLSVTAICLDGATLSVRKKRTAPMTFNFPGDVKTVHRFGADARNEMVVELAARGKTFRLITSQYRNADGLRELLTERAEPKGPPGMIRGDRAEPKGAEPKG